MAKADNPRAVIGSNSGEAEYDVENIAPAEGVVDVTKLKKALPVVVAQINNASGRRRVAVEKMRDERRDYQAGHKEAYEAIESIRKNALLEMQNKLRSRPGYVEAEADKVKASAEIRGLKKSAKEAGVDMQALGVVLKMGSMDPVEREDFFDTVDQYAKALRYWGPSYNDD